MKAFADEKLKVIQIATFVLDKIENIVGKEKNAGFKNLSSGNGLSTIIMVHNTTKLFADDAKIYSVVNSANDQDDLQNDLKQLDKWSQDWLLKFNPEKCSHLHLGKNTGNSYELSNRSRERSRNNHR